MKLAYQTNTWGGVVGHPAGVTSVKDLYYLTPGSNEEALQDIAQAGYAGFELFDGNLMPYKGREQEFRALLERTHLHLVGVYSGANFIYGDILDDELSKIRGVVEFAAALGAEQLVVGAAPCAQAERARTITGGWEQGWSMSGNWPSALA